MPPRLHGDYTLGFLDGRYLKLDTSNDPLTGDLTISKSAPTLTFDDTGGSVDWTIAADSNDDLLIAPSTIAPNANTVGIDGRLLLLPNVSGDHAGLKVVLFNPTYNETGTGGDLINFAPNITTKISFGGAFTLFNSAGEIALGEAPLLNILYRMFAATLTLSSGISGAAPAQAEIFDDISVTQAEGGVDSGTTTIHTTFLSEPSFKTGADNSTGKITDVYGLRVQGSTDAAQTGASYTVVNRYGARIDNFTVSNNASLTNQYGIYVEDIASGGTLNYGIYVGGGSDGAIVIDKDGTTNGSILLGASKNADIHFDSTDLVIDPDLSGSGKVKIGGGMTVEGSATFQQDATFQDEFYWEDNSPSQIISDQNNYSPGDFSVLRLSTDATRSITGFSGGAKGRVLVILNIGSNNLQLTDEDTNSTAANRIITGTAATITIASDESAMIWYDSTDNRWRVINVR